MKNNLFIPPDLQYSVQNYVMTHFDTSVYNEGSHMIKSFLANDGF